MAVLSLTQGRYHFDGKLAQEAVMRTRAVFYRV